jgi:hypothetical protein
VPFFHTSRCPRQVLLDRFGSNRPAISLSSRSGPRLATRARSISLRPATSAVGQERKSRPRVLSSPESGHGGCLVEGPLAPRCVASMQSLAEALNDISQIAYVLLDHAPKFFRRRMFLVRFSLRCRWAFVAGRHSRTVLPRGKGMFELDQGRAAPT